MIRADINFSSVLRLASMLALVMVGFTHKSVMAATVLVPLPLEFGAVKLAYPYAASLLERQAYLVRRLNPPSSGPRAPPYAMMMF